MSEDIRKWSDGRYTLMFDEHTFFVYDNENDKRMTALQTTKKLNEQQATITALKEENEQLRKSVEYWQKKYEEGTETLEIGEQQATIERLERRIKFLEKLADVIDDE